MVYADWVNVEIDEVLAVTERAMLVVASTTGDEVWIPFSLVDPECGIDSVGDAGTLIVRRWIAVREGLIDG